VAVGYANKTISVGVVSEGSQTDVEQNISLSTAPVTSQDLSVGVSGNGSGSVTSNPLGINCPVSCKYAFMSPSVTLTAFPDVTSTLFSGWVGDACTVVSANACTISLESAKEIVAYFILAPVRGGGSAYATLQQAIGQMTGGTIQAVGQAFADSLIISENYEFILRGGYDEFFVSQTGVTRLLGTLSIDSGSLTAEWLEIE
jgi:hypothetical protein